MHLIAWLGTILLTANNMNIKVEYKIKEGDLLNLLDSVSRGSFYWLESELFLESIARKALTETGIKVVNIETERRYTYTLNRSKVERGISLMAIKDPESFSDILSGNHDNDTADMFVQYCLFGKVVYS